MKHKRIEHGHLVTACKNFKIGKCIYGNERWWFKHKKDYETEDKKHIESKDFENNKDFLKIFEMMKKKTSRITDIEKHNH